MKNKTTILVLAGLLCFPWGLFSFVHAQEGKEMALRRAYAKSPAKSGQWYYVGMSAKEPLERARSFSPDNYAIPFHLGLIYLREGNRDAAIQEWEKYLAIAPEDSKSVSVRERLTVLKMRQATDFAKEVVKRGPVETRLPENTMAVLNFKNLATPDSVPFIKALTMMIITDLSKVPQLRLVERVKIQALMDEMRLGQTGLVDPAVAPRVGQLLLARNITWGELGVSQEGNLETTSMVCNTLNHTVLGKMEAEGSPEKFFELEKQIVFGILYIMGLSREALEPSVVESVEKVHTTNLKAFIAFGEALDHLDQNDFAEARMAFEKAVQADPDFDLAIEGREATPNFPTDDDYPIFDTLFDTLEEAEAYTEPEVEEKPMIEPFRKPTETYVDISDPAQQKLETETASTGVLVRW